MAPGRGRGAAGDVALPADAGPAVGPVRFLYVGSSDVRRDLAAWMAAGARRLWHFAAFGTEVAAVDVGMGPNILLAGHRPPGTVLPVVAVADLEAAAASLVAAGWRLHGGRVEIPTGPCQLVEDASGAVWALFEDLRPDAMAQSYGDASNPNAVR